MALSNSYDEDFCENSQKLKYLENEKSFWDEIKIIFHHF